MNEETTQITVTDMAGLLAAVPMLVGFKPARSLVVVCLREGRVACTMRVDLNGVGANVRDVAKQAVRAARRSKADELVVVGYVPRVGPWIAEAVRDLAIAVEHRTMTGDHPLWVRHLAVVGDAGWCELEPWSQDFPELRPVAEIESQPVVAHGIYAGKVVAASREELADRVRPHSAEPPEGFADAYAVTVEAIAPLGDDDVAAYAARALDRFLLDEQVPTGDVLGMIAALVTHPGALEPAMARINRHTHLAWQRLWGTRTPWALTPRCASDGLRDRSQRPASRTACNSRATRPARTPPSRGPVEGVCPRRRSSASSTTTGSCASSSSTGRVEYTLWKISTVRGHRRHIIHNSPLAWGSVLTACDYEVQSVQIVMFGDPPFG